MASDLYLYQLLNPDGKRYSTAAGPVYAERSNGPDLNYKETASDEHYKYYTATTGKWKINIRISKQMKLEGKVGEMIWVYKEIRTMNGKEMTIRYRTDNSYGFLLDNDSRKPLLPGQYAKEMDLQVLFIKQ